MPPPNYMQPSYFGAMDRPNYFHGLDMLGPVYTPSNVQKEGINTGLSTKQLGTTLNPMQNQLQALQAKIREGASKVEFEFMGRDKGSSQASTPESYGKEEREMMRKIAALNNIQSSTHATFQVSGLAGFSGQQGFRKQQQDQTIIEVQRAIDFARDATTGGAIVVHTGEWQRPVSHHYGQGEGYSDAEGNPLFEQYEDEDKEAQLLVVDNQTGELIQGISKNREVVMPAWHTAESYGKMIGKDLTGKGVDIDGKEATIRPDDFVDQNGNYIDPKDTRHLFRRVPKYNPDINPDDPKAEVKFLTETLNWDELKKRAEEWNERYSDDKDVEEFFAMVQIDNQILQAKGNSLFHLRQYEHEKEKWDAYAKAIEYYEGLKKSLPEEEKWRLMTQYQVINEQRPQEMSIIEFLHKRKRDTELSMRHIHESSAAADTRASELEKRKERIESINKYGIRQTGHALALLAEEAMVKSKAAREIRKGTNEKFEDLYIAPENWHPRDFGSHPEELLDIVKEGRKQFKERLATRGVTNKDEQERLARAHIKTTFDIGHLNMWRRMMKRDPKESEDQFQKRFNKWIFKHLEELHKIDAIGHVHLTDNFGYNDEHLSIGQGNAPVTEFVKWMTDRGHDDFIIEPGSFNATTIMPDTWSLLGAINWKPGIGPDFRSQHMAHGGLYAPPNYIVGGYVPSNEWTLWSQVPLE